MRQALITVRDGEDAATDGAALFSALGAVGLDDLEFVSYDGTRVVIKVDVWEALDDRRVSDIPSVGGVECLSDDGPRSTYLVEFEVPDAPCPDPGGGTDPGTEMAFTTVTVNDDGLVLEVTGSQTAISEIVAEFEDAGANVTLQALRDYETAERPLDALTDRQREVIRVAYEEGYFEVPRETSVEAIAAALDIDSSTVSEHLQRAQGNLLAAILP